MKNIGEFISRWYEFWSKYPDQRVGQSLWNFAAGTPATWLITHKYSGSDVDPFYHDERVLDFLKKIEEEANWED